MTHSRRLAVSGIPAGLYQDDLLRDKLLIHFLQRRNGGNGEVYVQYPTGEEGVATLTFDLAEVAEQILTRRHLLEVNGSTYPLEVSHPEPRGTRFSVPVTTTLNMKYFDSLSEVRRLLQKHNLHIIEQKSIYLFIEGDFRDLSECRDELYETMKHSSCSRRQRGPASSSNKYYSMESLDKGHVPTEGHIQRSSGKESPVSSLPAEASYNTSERDPSPSRGRKTPQSMLLHNEVDSSSDRTKPPYIKPSLTRNPRPRSNSVGAALKKPKDTSEDATAIKKHSNRSMAAKFTLQPPQKAPPDRSSPLPSYRKIDFTQTQSRGDFPESNPLRNTPSQDYTKSTISDEFISIPNISKNTVRESSTAHPGQPKITSADHVTSISTLLKSIIGGSSRVIPGDTNHRSADGSRANSKHLMMTSVDDANFNLRQPMNTSASEFKSLPTCPKSTVGDATSLIPREPKSTSAVTLDSNPTHPKTTMGDSTYSINSREPKSTSDDISNSRQTYPRRTTGDSTYFNSGEAKSTSGDSSNSSPTHSRRTTRDTTHVNSREPKSTSDDSSNSSPTHPRRTTRDINHVNPRESKSTSNYSSDSNPTHPRRTTRDNTHVNPRESKSTSDDSSDSNPTHSRRTTRDTTHLTPDSSSLKESTLNKRNPESSRSADLTSYAVARQSSSRFPSLDSTEMNSRSPADQSSLCTDVLVDPAVQTYINVFMADMINRILSMCNMEMETRTCEGFNTLILRAKSPDHPPELFYKGVHEISDIFMTCQNVLRTESIDLSTLSDDLTKDLQRYLYHCAIWSSVSNKKLQMIGESKDLFRFKEKWMSAKGDFRTFVQLSLEENSSGSSRPPVPGMDNVSPSPTHTRNTTQDVRSRRSRSRDRGAESRRYDQT